MPELIAPTSSFPAAWIEAHREWGPGQHEDGFGLSDEDELDSSEGFASWIRRLAGQSECTYRWIVDGNAVLGGIALRHEFTDFVARMGHIGYGIRPSARRRGVATWALGRMLDEAKAHGFGRALIVCEADNIASAKVIENNGGILEAAGAVGQPEERRYWIEVNKREADSI
jgi:predicted acetyltransferase